MELKVFTLPTCSSCSVAKAIASEVAQEFALPCKEVDLATQEGLDEGLALAVLSTPSIALDGEVIVRGRLISKEKLEEEVRKRLQKWKERVSKE